MTLFAHLFNSTLFVLIVILLPAWITFGLGGGWWGVAVLFGGAWLNRWAQRHLRNRKFRPPTPRKAKEPRIIAAPPVPVPVVAQAVRPHHAGTKGADFLHPLPPALLVLMQRGFAEGEGKPPAGDGTPLKGQRNVL